MKYVLTRSGNFRYYENDDKSEVNFLFIDFVSSLKEAKAKIKKTFKEMAEAQAECFDFCEEEELKNFIRNYKEKLIFTNAKKKYFKNVGDSDEIANADVGEEEFEETYVFNLIRIE